MTFRATRSALLALCLGLIVFANACASGPGEDHASAEKHWAFQPIREVVPPRTTGKAPLSGNAVDRFITAKLAGNGLTLAPPASRRALIRRAAFDLIGLPPTPDEVEAFVSDPASDAYERLVERLLASPRYGERWGRWWLDLARYADTNGQDENKVMANAWRYRDWVIRAFNADKPFDEFITEQLAGDLLPTNGVPEEVIFDRWTATGLLVLGPKMLAEQDKPKLVMDLVDEQIDTVGRAFLGLTVACARCHDHKFDPIPTHDYYALAGIFKSTRAMENLEFVSKFNERRIATREQLAAIEAHEKELAAKNNAITNAIQQANSELLKARKERFAMHLATVSTARHGGSVQTVASVATNAPDAGVVVRLQTLLAADPATNSISRALHEIAAAPANVPAFLRDLESMPTGETGLRLAPGKVGAAFAATGANHLELPHSPALDPTNLTVEAWVSVSEFPKDGDTRRWLVNKNSNEWTEGHYGLLIDRGRAGAYLNIGGRREDAFLLLSNPDALKPEQWHHLAFTYDGAMLRLFVDGKAAGELAINRPRVAGSTALSLGRRQDGYVNFKGLLDEVRVFGRALTADEVKAHFTQPERDAGEGVVARWEFNDLSDAERTALAQAELREALFGPDGVLALPKDPRPLYPPAARDAIVALEAERDALKAAAAPPAGFALAVAEDKPADLPVHLRGSHLTFAKEPVPRGFIQVVGARAAAPSIPADQSGRLELARWLTCSDNPLTARVIVNRIWQAHFGEGLVRTPDNFGLRGEPPTHPELLDWLAREFIRSGWSVKAMHRLLMTSATYQQASAESRKLEAGSRNDPAVAGASLPTSDFALPTSADPDNRLLSHFPRQRLEAEMIRDALLAVSGRLDAATGGSLVDWKNNEYVPKDDVAAGSRRRSVYLPIVRDRVFDVFTIFDFANPSVGSAKRTPTVVSHQALFFMNSPLVKDCARAFAESLLAAPEADEAARIHLAYERAFSRPPTEKETVRASRFLAVTNKGNSPESRLAAWSALCQTLFAANEFVYRE
jgi:hypothetical protein